MMIGDRARRKGLREHILELIPVYSHYKLEEEMREWDRSVRDEAVSVLEKSEQFLVSQMEEAVNIRDRARITSLESCRSDLHMLREKIKTQAYGYAPRYTPVKIDRKILEDVLDLDEEIVSDTRIIHGILEAGTPDYAKISSHLENAGGLLKKREKLLRTGLLEE